LSLSFECASQHFISIAFNQHLPALSYLCRHFAQGQLQSLALSDAIHSPFS